MERESAAAAMVEDDSGGRGEEGMVRWERFMPRVSMKVLLVESDNSTRQIITALLRKCSYTVSATSDGLKAWETLKENPQNIDLVLTEVELPSISGFTLLTMMMDHEICKHIPVIMMSSHDSISMVFKCMLKGAADFLVKPLRKNELRNLWQHVWRKHMSNGQDVGRNHGHIEKNREKNILDDHTREKAAFIQENKECSEKGSDAQSSCTRIEMEAESTCPQSILDTKQQKSGVMPLMGDTVTPIDGHHILSYDGSPLQGGESKDEQVMLDTEANSFNGVCKLNVSIPRGDSSHGAIEATHEDKTSKEAIDLIGGIDTQICVQRNATAASDASESLACEKDTKYKSSSMPHLELSLRRYQQSNCYHPQNGESSTLNHSTSSAFSQYNNKTLILSLAPTASETGSRECFTATKSLTDQGSNNASNVSRTRNMTREDTNSFGLETSPGVTVQCTLVRNTPFPSSIRETDSDNLHGTPMQPIYYPKAAHHSWNTAPSAWQEAVQMNSSYQTSLREDDFPQSEHQDDSTKNVMHYHAQEQEENKEMSVDQRDGSSLMGDNGSNDSHNFNNCHPNISGSGSSCDRSTGNNNETSIPETKPESGNNESHCAHEGIRLTDLQRLSQREAALNKFRLKRKERCFEKKVRYHSRQRLAEQRPRVKGQFVRQVQPDSQTM